MEWWKLGLSPENLDLIEPPYIPEDFHYYERETFEVQEEKKKPWLVFFYFWCRWWWWVWRWWGMRRMRVRMMMRMLRVMRECNPLIELPNAIPWKFFPLPPTWMETLEIKVAPIFLLFNVALDMGRKKKIVCSFESVCPYVKNKFGAMGGVTTASV